VKPDFQLGPANEMAVAALCRKLEGLPLAIELAAARAGVLSPSQILEPLEDRFDLLVTRRRGASSRHHSLRATMDWSYQLLPPELQRFFARLSVFRGGWALEAAQSVAWAASGNGQETPGALEALEQLHECSLILTGEVPGVQVSGTREAGGCSGVGQPLPEHLNTRTPEHLNTELHFRFLETLREFAAEQLDPEERVMLVRQHARYYLEFAEAAEPKLRRPEQNEWLERVAREGENLRAALEGCRLEEDGGLAELRMVGALFWLGFFRGRMAEGRQSLDRALARSEALGRSSARAKALFGTGVLATYADDFAAALAAQEEAIAICREVGDRLNLAQSLRSLGVVTLHEGDPVGARRLLEESLGIGRELEEPWIVANGLTSLARLASHLGEHAEAHRRHQEGLAIFRSLNDRASIAWTLEYLGDLARARGDTEAAAAHYRECLAWARDLGPGMSPGLALDGLAKLAAARGQAERATRLFAAAEAVREAIGLPTSHEHADPERDLTSLRAALGERAFAAAWAEGRALAWEQAAAL
jgi:tetratricopeptide (TPR) repeat protein